MKVSIIGTGYVGLTTGVALAELGNDVVLVDVVPEKLKTIERGNAPFYEPGISDLLAKNISNGRICTSLDILDPVLDTEATFISVGTPSKKDGSMEDSYIRQASRDIGEALAKKEDFHVVIMKSTVVPGTTSGMIKEVLENASGKVSGKEFGVAMCPEFLREGSAMHDSLNPDRVVIGCEDDRTFDVLKRLFEPLGSKILRTSPTAAEMIKYTSNSLLATKISFANEISRICEDVGVDVYEIMEGVGMDLRISPQFLRAGVGFGGSCFPKDVSALMHIASARGLLTPVLDGVMKNNRIQPVHLVDTAEKMIGGLDGLKVGVLGLAFKPDTDDIRETRSLPLIKELIKKGAEVTAHDPKAVENFKMIMPDIGYEDDLDKLLVDVDILFLMTEWS
ncbi:MAG: UDP-glucose/GDP-mannose dehydrogenase family protein, partial [Candidatus Thermoplasmatota archaeon]|nr:UDP-glucose/GDP-mannose dehydrogenase family protein [Candidatus Thermoplasmatota archaeon]